MSILKRFNNCIKILLISFTGFCRQFSILCSSSTHTAENCVLSLLPLVECIIWFLFILPLLSRGSCSDKLEVQRGDGAQYTFNKWFLGSVLGAEREQVTRAQRKSLIPPGLGQKARLDAQAEISNRTVKDSTVFPKMTCPHPDIWYLEMGPCLETGSLQMESS